jgi:hypothetical protein
MREPPNAGWLPFAKMGLGFLLLILLAVLAMVIALGKVEQSTSYGLNIILGGLLTLAGGFTQWCFGESRSKDDK